MSYLNIIKQEQTLSKLDKESLLNQRGFVIWLTGLSGSGKSTIANELEKKLNSKGKLTTILDGDNIRLGLCKDLSFSDDDRKENIRRIAEVSKLLSDTGVITITAFISPFIEEREMAKSIVGKENFIEVYVSTSLQICEIRDVKGLYKKARSGEIKKFTGIDSPYESPLNPDLVIDQDLNLDESVDKIINHLSENNYISYE
jgi:adenylylsulfate kinase